MEEPESKNSSLPSDVSPPESLPFVEVICSASGKTRRFSFGTEAGFAVNLINKTLLKEGLLGLPFASHIEAVKEGEEAVSFGPNSLLVNYGHGWKLRSAIDFDGLVKGDKGQPGANNKGNNGSHSMKIKSVSLPPVSVLYISKIILAFIFIFILGAIFTMALENLPRLISYINSSL